MAGVLVVRSTISMSFWGNSLYCDSKLTTYAVHIPIGAVWNKDVKRREKRQSSVEKEGRQNKEGEQSKDGGKNRFEQKYNKEGNGRIRISIIITASS